MRDWKNVSLQEIVEQLEFCGYECEAGQLVMNAAFQELKKRANIIGEGDITINDIDTTTWEGRLVIAILADVTTLPKHYRGDKPNESWHPDEAVNHYAELARKLF